MVYRHAGQIADIAAAPPPVGGVVLLEGAATVDRMETPTPLTDRWTPTFETLTDLQDTRVWDAEFADVIDEARQRRDQQRWQLDGRVLRARANPVTIRRWLQASSERFPEVYRSSDWKTICHGSAISVSGVPLVADALVNVHHLIFDLLAPEVTS